MIISKFNKIEINKKMCMDNKYNFRLETLFYDDSENKDEWQNEVYLKAKKISEEEGLYKIFDFGCGSGYKVIKYFGDKDYSIFMYDFKKTIEFVKNKYEYLDNINFIEAESGFNKKIECDIVIMADVIEHVLDPNNLINIVLKNINFKYLVVSTPDRGILYDESSEYYYGPPKNIHHIREWSFSEFRYYFLNNFGHLNILEHYISNYYQKTQCIVLKNNMDII